VEYIHAEKLRVTKCAFDRIFEFLPPLLILECSINKPALLCHTRVELLSGGMQATWYRIWNCFFTIAHHMEGDCWRVTDSSRFKGGICGLGTNSSSHWSLGVVGMVRG
jgi:hypothetical protein